MIEYLDLNKFSIFGVSGGGAYCLSFAATGFTSTFKVGLVASIYPFAGGKAPKDMCRLNKFAFWLAKYFPWPLKFSYHQQKKLLENNPFAYIKSMRKNINHLCSSDQDVLASDVNARSVILHLREAFRSSPSEAVNELKLLSGEWEIVFSSIHSKVEVWHGEDDTLSPISGMKDFVRVIPDHN